jgi:polyhydroxyalkanoate synthase
MDQSPPTPELNPLQAWSEQWRAFGSAWAKWWLRPLPQATGTSGMPALPPFGEIAQLPLQVPPALFGAALVDPQAVTELNARFLPRLQELWTAASEALASAGGPAGLAGMAGAVGQSAGEGHKTGQSAQAAQGGPTGQPGQAAQLGQAGQSGQRGQVNQGGQPGQHGKPGTIPPTTKVREVVPVLPGDRRFKAPEWSEHPYFSLLKQYYLLSAEYLTALAELSPAAGHDKLRLAYLTRQFADALSPANFPTTNPEVLKKALETQGKSLAQGLNNLLTDTRQGRITMSDASAFAVGENLAITPGSVVFRNDLIELIQYTPTTERVHERPLLIVPPCINKYYILDLQPNNSFVRWTLAQGQQLFLISWRNITPELGQLGWDDYLQEGVLTAIDVVKAITGSETLNTLGFCVGGALLTSALAALAARGDTSVNSVTLLTTMLDYADPGEIRVYVSEDMLSLREASLHGGQIVQGGELAGAFASLRANDLVWNYVVKNYLKGETPPPFDLLHWNADSANLPGPMYAYYVRNFYIDNKLREPGALTMLEVPIDLGAVKMPAYVYASREDHIVPWPSAYRSTGLLGGDITFVLGASGHIAGVINPPASGKRNYWTNATPAASADNWFAGAESHPGSWWPHWGQWLAERSGDLQPAPTGAGNDRYSPLAAAPGTYVVTPGT